MLARPGTPPRLSSPGLPGFVSPAHSAMIFLENVHCDGSDRPSRFTALHPLHRFSPKMENPGLTSPIVQAIQKPSQAFQLPNLKNIAHTVIPTKQRIGLSDQRIYIAVTIPHRLDRWRELGATYVCY